MEQSTWKEQLLSGSIASASCNGTTGAADAAADSWGWDGWDMFCSDTRYVSMIIHDYLITDPHVVYVLYCFVTCPIGYPLFQALEGQRPSCEAPSAWVPSLASEKPTGPNSCGHCGWSGWHGAPDNAVLSKAWVEEHSWKDSPLDKWYM